MLCVPLPAFAQGEPPEDLRLNPDGPVSLPSPTLPEESAAEAPDTPPEEPASPRPDPVVLYRIQRSPDEAIEPDIGFETPGDLRVETSAEGRLPPVLRPSIPPRPPAAEASASTEPTDELDALIEPEWKPSPFRISAGAGWSRLLAVQPIDYARIEERFEARIPDFEALTVGVGLAQLVDLDGRFLFEGGARVAFGFFFCAESWVRCEGGIALQPGVIAGDSLGVQFDLHGALDMRFLLEERVEINLTGAYSLVGPTSLVHVTGLVGVVF